MSEVIIAAISTIGTIVVAIITGKESHKTRDEIRKYGEKTNEALKDILRRDIVNLYYKRKDNKFLYQFERESLDKEYEGYKELKGNTFVDDLYKDMRDWEVKR